MKKILVLLLLVSTVIGMAVPAMANPTNKKAIDIDISGFNAATSTTTQKLINEGDLTNVLTSKAGDATAVSIAANDNDAKSGDATNKCPATAEAGDAEAEDHSKASNTAKAKSKCDADSKADNFAWADSKAIANGGDSNVKDVKQDNAVVQKAFAKTDINQKLIQTVKIDEFQKIDIDDSILFENNEVDGIAVVAGDDAFEDKNKLSA